MPATKKAMIRYGILDELFQNRQRPLPTRRILEILKDRLKEMGEKPIGLRALQKDIKAMKESPWYAPIEQMEIEDDDPEHGTKKMSKGYYYDEPGFSIFHKDLSHDEKQLLKAALAMLGQFDGIPQLEGLKRLVDTTKGIDSNQIVLIERNPIDDTSLLGELYLTIADKCSINLYYHTYGAPNTVKTIGFYPYLLKQCNRRWYLIGAASKDNEILTFCLDRINKVERTPTRPYVPPRSDIRERFEEIIGITFYKREQPVRITYWVSDYSKDYIFSKPLHDSQTHIKQDEELRKKYFMLKGGAFFYIDVRYNKELIRELCAYGANLVVLTPKRIQREISERIREMTDIYRTIRI